MTKRKKRQTAKKKKQSRLTWAFVGLSSLIFAVVTLLPFGLLGRQVINLFRFFVGDSYLVMSVLLLIFGFVMVIYNQPPHLGFKRTSGLIMAYLGFLIILSTRYFDQILIHQNFVNVFWQQITNEFARGNATVPLGGGMIGTIFYQFLFPLISALGCLILGSFAIIIGVLMFFNLKFRQVLSGFQKFSRFFIAKNQNASRVVKQKYGDLLDGQKERQAKKALNREKLEDPLESSQDFPDTQDFASSATHTIPVEEKAFSETEKDDSIKETDQEDENDIASQMSSEKMVLDEPRHEAMPEHEPDTEKAAVGAPELASGSDSSSKSYQLPPLSLLSPTRETDQSQDRRLIQKNKQVLEKTFKSFGVKVIVKTAILGPTVTRYEVQPAVGVKVSRIVNLTDDLALALAAKDIRIEAPIPGKPLIGIEVPNKTTSVVSFREVMAHQDQVAKKNALTVPLGKAVTGRIISADLRKMPHLLIAGSTGSGKSVAINTIITSILMKARPEEVKLVLIDPKMVELSVYNQIPHLLIPVVTNAKLAANALHKTVKEMERRYQLFAAGGVRNMKEYNQKAAENNLDSEKAAMPLLPYIVVIVDELSDLMMVAGHEVEDAIVRLAQMARAAGIHMILATQRPSVDVITGLIKANVPSRISFAVSSGIDSRTILDQTGAEKLVGRGDMLFMPIGASKPERIQGAFISVDEVERVVAFVKQQKKADYSPDMMPTAASPADQEKNDEEDEYYAQAVDLVRNAQQASVSMLQRRFRIGYNRAARIVDEMEAKNIIGPSEGSKPRQVLLPPKAHDKQEK